MQKKKAAQKKAMKEKKGTRADKASIILYVVL